MIILVLLPLQTTLTSRAWGNWRTPTIRAPIAHSWSLARAASFWTRGSMSFIILAKALPIFRSMAGNSESPILTPSPAHWEAPHTTRPRVARGTDPWLPSDAGCRHGSRIPWTRSAGSRPSWARPSTPDRQRAFRLCALAWVQWTSCFTNCMIAKTISGWYGISREYGQKQRDREGFPVLLLITGFFLCVDHVVGGDYQSPPHFLPFRSGDSHLVHGFRHAGEPSLGPGGSDRKGKVAGPRQREFVLSRNLCTNFDWNDYSFVKKISHFIVVVIIIYKYILV